MCLRVEQTLVINKHVKLFVAIYSYVDLINLFVSLRAHVPRIRCVEYAFVPASLKSISFIMLYAIYTIKNYSYLYPVVAKIYLSVTNRPLNLRYIDSYTST